MIGFFPRLLYSFKFPPKWRFIIIHGGLAVTGIVLAIIFASNKTDDNLPMVGLVLSPFAVLGGIGLFVLRELGAPITKTITLMHAFVGCSVLGLFILFLFGVEI